MAILRRAPPPFDWDTTLNRKKGKARLSGVDVWYDFNWPDLFGHDRATFKHGQSLTSIVRNWSPSDKTPCLLLTTRHDVEQRAIQTDTHYVRVIRIKEYLAKASANPAMAYLAITAKEELDDFFDLHLDDTTILRWARREPGRIVCLLQLVAVLMDDDGEEASSLPRYDVGSAIAALEDIAPQLLAGADSDELRGMANWLSGDARGRRALSNVLAEDIPNRIEDVRSRIQEYRELLDKPSTTEITLQEFITEDPSLLGLEYARVRPKAKTTRGEVDFLVQRHDGYHDVVELKAPNDPIIKCDSDEHGGPVAASKYSLGPALARALAQVQVYQRQLTRGAKSMEDDFGIKNTQHPRITIVVGRDHSLPDPQRNILRQLNRNLHGIEIMPYDVLAERAEIQLKNLETLLSAEGLWAD